MKRRLLSLAMMILLLNTGSALATSIETGEELTDVPGLPTQDSVVSIKTQIEGQDAEVDVEVGMPGPVTMEVHSDIYEFVHDESQLAADYFPPEEQQLIEEMYQIDSDSLYMTEFMRLFVDPTEIEGDVEVTMEMDVDYQVGQTVVVVLGDAVDADNVTWHVVEASVTAPGEITFMVPQELAQQVQGNVLCTALTVRPGEGGEAGQTEDAAQISGLPSKAASDLVSVGEAVDAQGNPLDHDFAILITEETDTVVEELDNMRAYVRSPETTGEEAAAQPEADAGERQPMIGYFPQMIQSFVQTILGSGVDASSLVCYEYLPLTSQDYRDTDGDVVVSFDFATTYVPGQKVAAVLGIPLEQPLYNADGSIATLFDWNVQRAEVNEDGSVAVTFSQLVVPFMENETTLLLVLSEPFSE